MHLASISRSLFTCTHQPHRRTTRPPRTAHNIASSVGSSVGARGMECVVGGTSLRRFGFLHVVLPSSFPIPPAKCRSVTRISSAGRVRRSRCVPSACKRRDPLAVHPLGVSSLDHAKGRTLVPLPLSTCTTTLSHTHIGSDTGQLPASHGEQLAPERVVLLGPNMKAALQGGHQTPLSAPSPVPIHG